MADNILHETNRNTKTARAAKNPCSETASGRPRNSPNGSNGRGIPKLCSSLKGCVQKRRTKSIGKQTASIKAVQAIQQTVVKVSKASLKRPKSKWLQNRLVDTTAYCKADTQAFRYKLPYRTRLATSAEDGLELSEAREASKRTQRAGHSQLAKEGLASYKKKPIEPAELLYWPMKAVLCLPQPCDALGHQKARHPFTIAGTEGTAFRRFLQSVFRRCVTGSVCISLFRTAISRWMILKRLYRCCWNIFQRVLFWFSTVGWFIAGQKEDCVRGLPNVSILNGSLLMPLILIRSSRSGITANTASLLITSLTTYWHLKKPYVNLSSIFVHKKLCYIRSSKKLDLKYDSFH